MKKDEVKTIELYHHGIKGQRWGVRRYQNPDGTLTTAGRARYGIDEQGHFTSDKGQKNLYKDIKRSNEQQLKLKKQERKVEQQLRTQALSKRATSVAEKQENTLREKRWDIKEQQDKKISEALKANVTDKERNELSKLIKRDEDLEFAIDEVEYGTPKYNKLIQESDANHKRMQQIYSDVGKRVVGKYANKRIKVGDYGGVKVTLSQEIGGRLRDEIVEELIEKGKW